MRAGRGITVVVAALAMAWTGAAPALGALPRAYRVQAVDRPVPEVGGAFGQGFVNAGDVNRDGRDDLLVGTDQRGGGTGPVFVISGADGATLRTIPQPDPGGSGGPSGFGGHVGALADLGSCPGGVPGTTCGGPAIGPPDGVAEHLAT
ncbi:MAG TPA: FG-GAP repeat protein, partial [Solirubrobacteraceae bacterium]|nr:FG-GAP repeat protein [Solirubrobacteraceae bacterium]